MGAPTSGQKTNPLWAPWAGVGLAVLGLLIRHTGAGQFTAMAGAIIALVAPVTLWNRVPPAWRVPLLIIPAVLGPVLFVVYLSIPHGRAV